MRTEKIQEKAKEFIGVRFNYLTIEDGSVIEKNGIKEAVAHCVCDCGNKLSVKIKYLKLQSYKSCGCLRKNRVSTRNRINTVYVDYHDERIPLIDLCEQTNANYKIIYSRMRRGWDIYSALNFK